jgi:glycosyltransferase involved in cell wall biosynthesis
MKKICILSRHATLAASSRLRTNQYVDFLVQAGYHVDVFPFFDECYLRNLYSTRRRNKFCLLKAYVKRFILLLRLGKYDCLWIEKELFPYLPGFVEHLITILNVPYVLDYDDATFHTYDNHKSSIIRFLLGKKLRPLIKNSFAVTVGNKYLADYAERVGASRIFLIPTVIDINKYLIDKKNISGDKFRVGWIGTPQTTKYLKDIIVALNALAKEIPLCLVLVGASDIGHVLFDVEYHQWSEYAEVEILNTIDVGLMPLPDEPWERGKCGYKLIQYMALGKPIIASPVGVNLDILENDVGLVATSSIEWRNALLNVFYSGDMRIRFSQNARRLVESEYNLNVTVPSVLEIFQLATK